MRRTVTLLAYASVLTLVMASCASSKDTGFPETPPPAEESTEGPGEDTSTQDDPAETDAINVEDSFFEPRFVTVAAGTTVTWTQTGAVPHTVTHDDARPKLQEARGEFDSHPDCPPSDCMGTGDTFEVTFDEPGEYPYFCVLHGAPGSVDISSAMNGLIIVE